MGKKQNVAGLTLVPAGPLEMGVQVIHNMLPQIARTEMGIYVVDFCESFLLNTTTNAIVIRMGGTDEVKLNGIVLKAGSFAVCGIGQVLLTAVATDIPHRILVIQLASTHAHEPMVRTLRGLDEEHGFSELMSVRRLMRLFGRYRGVVEIIWATLYRRYRYQSPREAYDALLVVLSGSGGCRIGEESESFARIVPGSVVFIPASQRSALRAGEEGIEVLLIELPYA